MVKIIGIGGWLVVLAAIVAVLAALVLKTPWPLAVPFVLFAALFAGVCAAMKNENGHTRGVGEAIAFSMVTVTGLFKQTGT